MRRKIVEIPKGSSVTRDEDNDPLFNLFNIDKEDDDEAEDDETES